MCVHIAFHHIAFVRAFWSILKSRSQTSLLLLSSSQFSVRETALGMVLSALQLHLVPSLVVLNIGGNRNVTGALASVNWYQMAALRELYLDRTGTT